MIVNFGKVAVERHGSWFGSILLVVYSVFWKTGKCCDVLESNREE